MSNNTKIIVIGAVIIFTYATLFRTDTQAQEDPLVAPEVQLSPQISKGSEILALLADLENIRLDEGIFSNPMFQELQDFSRELNPEPKGRSNPFAPLGQDAVLDANMPGFATTTAPRTIPFSTDDAAGVR